MDPKKKCLDFIFYFFNCFQKNNFIVKMTKTNTKSKTMTYDETAKATGEREKKVLKEHKRNLAVVICTHGYCDDDNKDDDNKNNKKRLRRAIQYYANKVAKKGGRKEDVYLAAHLLLPHMTFGKHRGKKAVQQRKPSKSPSAKASAERKSRSKAKSATKA